MSEFGFEDLKRILVDRVGLDDIPDDPGVSFDDLGLDSLAFVEVQLAMEQEWDVVISDEEAHSIRTLADATEFMNRKLAEA